MAVFILDEQADVGVDIPRLTALATYVLADQAVPGHMELSVLCVDRDTMHQLNGEHMGAEGPTDVLAFPLDAPEAPAQEVALLGDVVICPAVAAAQAGDLGRTTSAELDLLLVHGILHLLGHDHAEEEERRVMFTLTDSLLAGFAATVWTMS